MNDEKDLNEDIYRLKSYPLHLRKIVKVLLKYESSLTDGFEWYADVTSITGIAQELYDLNK